MMFYTKEKLEKLQERWATPAGKQVLERIKQSRCYLSPVLFKQKTKKLPHVDDKEVKDAIDLRGAPLSGFDFRVPIKENDDEFTEDLTILSNIHLEGAQLKHCNFQDGKIHDCFFEEADLAHAEFQSSTISTCNFREADCSGMNIHGAKLIDCNFSGAIIKDMTTAAVLIDQKTTFGKELKSEKEKNFHFATIEYKQIKEMYKNSSLHEQADQYHHKEMVAKRKTKDRKNPMRALNFLFGDILCKYGTSFTRVLFTSATIITICAFLYTIRDGLLYHNQPVYDLSFFHCLYFSIVTFTTLGYGDYHAIGAMRFVAAAEAFIGATLMALFTVIVARSIIRD